MGILTGFCVADLAEPTAETDGPPGALYLARALVEHDIHVELISDRFGVPLLACGVRHWGLPVSVCELPLGDRLSDAWLADFFRQRNLTHLVAIERAGPSHTRDSLLAQSRTGPPPEEEFRHRVPLETQNRCHNMRGVPIDDVTAPAHDLFDYIARQQLPITTIGIGDGGNEIGLGCLPWEYLCQAILQGPAERIACRVATDWTLVAGVSDWGGYALGLALAALRGTPSAASAWNCAMQRELVMALVREAGAVDGVTRQREATVDGLPLETYLQGLAGLRREFSLFP